MQVCRVATLRNPLCYAGVVHQRQAITGQSVIPGIIIRHQHLYPGVANILQLFIVRAIHVCFMRTKPGSTPADVKYLINFRIMKFEFGVLHKGITREGAIDIFNHQWLSFRFYLEPYVSICSPPEGRVFLVGGSIGDYTVCFANKSLSIEFIAISFGQCWNPKATDVFILSDVKTFCLPHGYTCILSTAEYQRRVGIG